MIAQGPNDNTFLIVAVSAALIVWGGILGFAVPLVRHWLRARSAGCPIDFMDVVGMKLRRVDAGDVVSRRIELHQSGIDLPVESLEIHLLVGGRLPAACRVMVAAKKAGVEVDWNEICALDLAGRDIEKDLTPLIARTAKLPAGQRRVDTSVMFHGASADVPRPERL
jgi:uncharacterized protein YqfA (UPF0365 family)